MGAVLASVLMFLVAHGAPAAAEGESRIATLEAFRAARDAGDHELARTFLTDNPRVWHEAREGEGYALKPGGGRYAAWDDHFNGHSEVGPWTEEGNAVWAIAEETNDYFRLIEREDVPRYRITYFFDGDGRIEGYLISVAHPGQTPPPRRDRFDEFEAWAKSHHPQEWEYLRPGGELDPTGDRAPRTRRLLEAWRRAVGLPELDGE